MDLKNKFPDGMLHSGCFKDPVWVRPVGARPLRYKGFDELVGDLTRDGTVTMATSGSINMVPDKDAFSQLRDLCEAARRLRPSPDKSKPLVIVSTPQAKEDFLRRFRENLNAQQAFNGIMVNWCIVDEMPELPPRRMTPEYMEQLLSGELDIAKRFTQADFEEQYLCKPLPEPEIDLDEPDRRHIRARASAKDIKGSKPWERL